MKKQSKPTSKSQARKRARTKNGAWFVHLRGSYLPASAEGWLLYIPLIAGAISVIFITYSTHVKLAVALPQIGLQLIGIGAIFSWIAARKS
jgi:hypothetical protein